SAPTVFVRGYVRSYWESTNPSIAVTPSGADWPDLEAPSPPARTARPGAGKTLRHPQYRRRPVHVVRHREHRPGPHRFIRRPPTRAPAHVRGLARAGGASDRKDRRGRHSEKWRVRSGAAEALGTG